MINYSSANAASHRWKARSFEERFRQVLSERDYPYALRLLGEYASASIADPRALMSSEPNVADSEYRIALAAITKWAAHKTSNPLPEWVQRVQPANSPIFLAEKIHVISPRMKQLVKRDTPVELADMNVWMRSRDLTAV